MSNSHSYLFRSFIRLVTLGIIAGLWVMPTAAILPAQQGDNTLSQADMALFNGDYTAAIGLYSNAVNDPASHCPALYGLGVTHLRAAQYQEADSAFTQYLNECESSFRALVMRGEAREQAGRTDEALADYQQAIALNPGVLDSYLYERMSSLNPDEAIHYLRLAAESARHPEGKFVLRERLAEVYLLVGSSSAALAEYNTLLSEIDAYLATLSGIEGAEFDQAGGLRARIELAAANIEIQTNPDAAFARLQRIITNYPETDSALPALVILVNANQSVDLLMRMRINVLNENYFPVVDVLSDYLSDPGTAANAPAELYLLLGRAQRGQGDSQAALATFTRLREQYPGDLAASTAMLEQGGIYAELGDIAQAAATYINLVNAYPSSAEAPIALLRAAEIGWQGGNRDAAITLYEQLAQLYPGSVQARQGLFEAGMALRGVDPARAAALLGQVGSAEGLLWQGKVLAANGSVDAARQAWEQAQRIDPGTFFSLRACELLNGRESLAISPPLRLPSSADTDRAAAEQWVAQVFNLPGVTADLSPELANDPMLQRGIELWAVGMWREARAEFDALHKLNRSNPAALLQLAFYYQTIPVHRSSIFAATRLVFASNQPILSIPTAILRLAFPIYYADLLIRLAAENDLDSLLVAALVRQESSFDPTNVSIADARGLMQLIPSTAQDVASRLQWPNYRLDDLFRPMVNLAFGTYYLNSMRAFQNGSIAGALLSYNAGPVAAQSWLNEAGGDIDVLYRVIDFAETKTYLDVIYVNHFIYQYLYTENAPTCGFESAVPIQAKSPAT